MQNCPIFFIGGRDRGLLALESMLSKGEKIVGACIMQEDQHEHERFFEKIDRFLRKKGVPYLKTNSVKNKRYFDFIKEKTKTSRNNWMEDNDSI